MTILRDQEEALQSTDGSRALVASMNKEVKTLKQTLVKTQNALETWRTKYHNADKNNTVLATKMDFFVGVEFVKFLLSAGGVSYGVNLISGSNNLGYLLGGICVLAYGLITWWQRKK